MKNPAMRGFSLGKIQFRGFDRIRAIDPNGRCQSGSPELVQALLAIKEGDVATKKTANKRVPATASKAAALLVSLGKGFIVPTTAQKKHILVALAKANKVVYGRAYDAIK